MRIVAGTHRGRKLIVPKNKDIRPTSDKVRGAVFNALESRGGVQGARVLDCFCGTGAMGFEAISRGAKYCVFWDKSATSLQLAKDNAQGLGMMDHAAFHMRDACKLKTQENADKFDLIILDPPYRNNHISQCLEVLEKNQYLDGGAYVVLEYEKGYAPDLSDAYTSHFERTYGDTVVMILNYDSNA